MRPSFRHIGGVLLLVSFAGCSSFRSYEDRTNYDSIKKSLSYRGRQSEELERQIDQRPSTNAFTVETISDFADSVDKGTRRAFGYAANPDRARELFKRGEETIAAAQQLKDDNQRKRKFLEAGALYAAAAKAWPESAIEHKSMFKAGSCYFWADHYVRSNEIYEKMIKKYPNSRFLDSVEAHRFSIAQYWLKHNEAQPRSYWAVNFSDPQFPLNDIRGQAIKIFDLIRYDDPTGKLADDATLAAANAHFAAGDYVDADEYYSDLRTTFTNSEHQFAAHFLGMKAKLKSYQGPEYSATPLLGAEKLAEQIRKQFPGEAAKHRETLERAEAEIRKEKAKRAWNLARYYEGRWQYGAAKYYYRRLQREFPATPIGKQAELRLNQLADKPDTPSQPLPWLVNLFPDDKTAKPILATAPSLNPIR